jgi:phage/plasmid-like protein (TIGR03299 family)
MPANVETMFSVNETPWHGLGVVIKDAPTTAEGIQLAGLDWQTEVESVYVNGNPIDSIAKAFVRSDNKKVLGIVGPNTHPLQNKKAFEFFDGFISAKEVSLETAGSLDEGRKIWVMAKINRDNSVIVPGDDIAKFVLVSNSHDGTTAVRVGFTPIRVVCANTLAMAHKDSSSKLIRVRHSKQVNKNVDAIRDIINIANADFEATAEQFRFLASRHINANDLRKYVTVVLKLDEKENISTRSRNMILDIERRFTSMVGADFDFANKEKEILEAVTENFEAGRGTENKRSRGTYWTAYNAVNEYLNYERGNSKETRLNSLWFGVNAASNKFALDTALDMANAA